MVHLSAHLWSIQQHGYLSLTAQWWQLGGPHSLVTVLPIGYIMDLHHALGMDTDHIVANIAWHTHLGVKNALGLRCCHPRAVVPAQDLPVPGCSLLVQDQVWMSTVREAGEWDKPKHFLIQDLPTP